MRCELQKKSVVGIAHRRRFSFCPAQPLDNYLALPYKYINEANEGSHSTGTKGTDMSTKKIVAEIARELKEAEGVFYMARNKANSSKARHERNEATIAAGGTVKRWNELEEGELDLDLEWLARASADVDAVRVRLAEAKEAWRNNPRARR